MGERTGSKRRLAGVAFLLLLIGSVVAVTSSNANAAVAVPIRVNANGPSFTGGGTTWSADQAYTSGNWGYDTLYHAGSTTSAIAGTTDDDLYRTYDQFNNWSGYRFDVANGSYRVTIKTMEDWATAAGQRRFDVRLENTVALSAFDIFAACGALTACDRSFTTTVSDGQLNLQFNMNGGAGYATVSAVEITSTTGGTTTTAPTSTTTTAPTSSTTSSTSTTSTPTTTTSTTAPTTTTTTPGGGGRPLIGYFAEWGVYQRNYHVKNIHTSGSAAKLTHILYAFGNVTNGRCAIGDAYADYDRFYSAAESVDGVADTWDAGALRGSFNQLRKLKQMYPNLKVIWSFGGWTWSGGFSQAAQNPQAFADSCYQLVEDPRWADVFDGIDIDWEYPNACGLSCDTSGFAGYRNLMQALRARFGSNLVTSAITADGTTGGKIDAADYAGAAQYVDWYMVMTYDFFGAFDADGPTAPHSPLTSYPGIPVPGFYGDNAIQRLKGKGVPGNKLMLGIGFYGRGWTGVSQSAPGGSASGPAPGTYEQGIDDYKVLRNRCPANGTVAGTAYAHCGSEWWSYDTPSTIGGKMTYVRNQGLRGAFFWELSGDTANGELITAMRNGL